MIGSRKRRRNVILPAYTKPTGKADKYFTSQGADKSISQVKLVQEYFTSTSIFFLLPLLLPLLQPLLLPLLLLTRVFHKSSW
jgi:hypothetical protein